MHKIALVPFLLGSNDTIFFQLVLHFVTLCNLLLLISFADSCNWSWGRNPSILERFSISQVSGECLAYVLRTIV